MTSFPLKIVTPDGLVFDDMVEQIVVRTTTGDMGILAGHINCVASLGTGQAVLTVDGKKRCADCIGGMLSVLEGEVRLISPSFSWLQENNP